jgi:hypothetical protein
VTADSADAAPATGGTAMMLRMATARRSANSPQRRTFPVTVTKMPVVRCDLCQETLAHVPGRAGDVLTDHYRRQHPAALP